MNFILKKKNKILFDTNVIIDILTNRNTAYNSRLILKESVLKLINASITSKQITDVYYILRKYDKNKKKRISYILFLMKYFKIISFTKHDIRGAFNINGKDFEDDTLIACSYRNKINYIVTNNKKDFINNNKVKIISPIELLKLI